MFSLFLFIIPILEVVSKVFSAEWLWKGGLVLSTFHSVPVLFLPDGQYVWPEPVTEKNKRMEFVLCCVGCTDSDWLTQQDDVNQICFMRTGKGLSSFLNPGLLLCCLRLFTFTIMHIFGEKFIKFMTITSFYFISKLSYNCLILPFDATLKICICSGPVPTSADTSTILIVIFCSLLRCLTENSTIMPRLNHDHAINFFPTH